MTFMGEELLEICEHSVEGFQPLIYFGTWQVAVLNYIEALHLAKIDTLERHPETAEVFVLTNGLAILFLGEGGNTSYKFVSEGDGRRLNL
jgi:hypothetical protein